MEKKGDVELHIEDHYGDFADTLNSKEKDSSKRGPKGFVEIYDVDENGNKQLIGKHNLVVYTGRETVACHMLNTPNPSLSSGAECTEFISWLGIGSGGVSSGDPLDPISPQNDNTDLVSEIAINSTDANCGDFRSGAYYKRPFDLITYERDYDNDDSWLIAKIMSNINIFDANGNNISEAGLFTSSSNVGGYSGHFTLFARVTFPVIVKSPARQLVFIWYLYF